MLSMYSLAFALTKDDNYLQAEQELRNKTQKLIQESLDLIKNKGLDIHTVISIFMTAYVYPVLMGKDEWKECFDSVLDLLHNNFNTLKSKLAEKKQTFLDLELFGLASMAATVLYRTDPEHYEQQINHLLKMNLEETLYKGVIGRPTSAFEYNMNPETGKVIQNTHLLNNALFLEMLRECA